MTFPKCHLLSLILVLLTASFSLMAQEKCGTVLYEEIRRQNNPGLEKPEQFEQWMQLKVSQFKAKQFNSGRLEAGNYTVPVVVHIINNGEAVGTGSNIPDAQIQSQIDILNRDYPRLNADTTLTLSGFKPVAGSININFVLAKQDPEGLPTTGILRVKGSKSGWLMSDNTLLKSQSYWPAENYLNIWVVNFTDPLGIIGYAQLPVSPLAGLENGSNDRLTDGVAIDYHAFGTGNPNLFAQYNLGRTATHEIGHFFGLRHIWGDDGGTCSGSDFCNDTPNQGDNNNGKCPTGVLADNCSTSIMYQNYMDYTNDACMNLFSKDQVARMVTVIENSPRRLSLLTSQGSQNPTTVADDLGIRRIATPGAASCSAVTPSIVVRNYGSNPISSAQITLSIDGILNQTKNATFAPALNHLDSATVTFTTLNLPAGFTYTVSYQIELTNGNTDGKPFNNLASAAFLVPAQAVLPLFESFNSTPSNWTILNPDGLKTWANVTAPNSNASNTAMFMDFYNYDAQGEVDQLISPAFDFSTDTVAVLKFDRAYAAVSSQYVDRLQVIVSTGCGFSTSTEIFNKAGSALATAPDDTSPFTPTSSSQWVTETIPLTQFLGQSNVRISFVATNDFGNNLYLDNVRIIIGSYSDLVLKGVKKPSPVTCVNNPSPVITVRNDGTNDISSITTQTTVGSSTVSQTLSGFVLQSGQEKDFTLNPWNLQSGTNTITITAQISNDALPTNNTITVKQVLSGAKEGVPLRENFDSNYPDWNVVSQNQAMKWVSVLTNKNISLEYKAFTNLDIGSNSWLASPVLDFSHTQKASMFFDLSYAQNVLRGSEQLQVLASKDCGQTFPLIVFDRTGDQFSNSGTASSWTPQQNSDWSRYNVNLDSVAGQGQVRLAIVVTNRNGNNLFLDNIEIYTDDTTNPPDILNDRQIWYNSDWSDPRITFNLQEKQTVRMQIFNPMGQIISDKDLPDTLNQTYHFDLSGRPGVYIVRIQVGSQLSTGKIFVPN